MKGPSRMHDMRVPSVTGRPGATNVNVLELVMARASQVGCRALQRRSYFLHHDAALQGVQEQDWPLPNQGVSSRSSILVHSEPRSQGAPKQRASSMQGPMRFAAVIQLRTSHDILYALTTLAYHDDYRLPSDHPRGHQ